ncbi:MAG TPA: SgcJ/EcaC family oxidoreductase [Thermoplasmata archaeon]|nr:SgcJ/EcaC family oxidoreductase [Thermoplasmata archaeon]
MADDPRTPVIEALVAAYVEFFGRHDAAALTTCYAPDADLANFHGKPLHGKEEIQAFFARAFQKNLAAVRLENPEHRVRYVADHVATLDLSATISGEKDPKGAPRPPRVLRCDGTLVQNPNGGWWIVVGHLRLQNPEGSGGKGAPSAGPPADADS